MTVLDPGMVSFVTQQLVLATGVEIAAIVIAVIGVAAAGTSAGLAAEAAKEEASDRAKLERFNAKNREDARLRKLAELRGAQRVSGAFAGIDLSTGSFRTLEEDRDALFRTANTNDSFETRSIIARVLQRGKNQRTAAILGGISDSASTVGSAASAGVFDPIFRKKPTAIQTVQRKVT